MNIHEIIILIFLSLFVLCIVHFLICYIKNKSKCKYQKFCINYQKKCISCIRYKIIIGGSKFDYKIIPPGEREEV